jgi:hypothetical protein
MKILLSLEDYEEFIANMLYINCLVNNQFKTILEFLCRSLNLFKDKKLGKALLSHLNMDYEECYSSLTHIKCINSCSNLVYLMLELEFLHMRDSNNILKNNLVNKRMKYFNHFKIDVKKFIQKNEKYEKTHSIQVSIENHFIEIFETLKVYNI